MTNNIIISLTDVKFTYPTGIAAINGVSFAVTQGERIALLGPNGSGKSTLILLIAGLLTPTSGNIKIFDEKTNSKQFQKIRHNIGIVFQDPDDQLFTPSVIEDIEYGPKNLKLSDKEIKTQSTYILEKIDITHLKNRPPHRLSFGEKKKVSLATALILKPKLLILDEPTANLDLTSRRNLITTLNELNQAGTTIITSTHDAEAIPELADRIIIINHGLKMAEGTTREILQNKNILEQTGLEPPTTVSLFDELKNHKMIQEIPLTIAEGKEALENILKNKQQN